MIGWFVLGAVVLVPCLVLSWLWERRERKEGEKIVGIKFYKGELKNEDES